MAADHGRAEAHPDDAHLRRGHRPAGRGGDQAVAAVEGAGRRERADVGQPAPSVPGACPARPGAQHQVRQLADRAGFQTGSSWACWTTRSATGSTRSIGPRSFRRCSSDLGKVAGGESTLKSGLAASTPSSATHPTSASRRMKEWAPLEVEYYKRAYAAAGKGNYESTSCSWSRG